VQPHNRGTAVGALLPLLETLERDPEARVVLLPSDHHVVDEPALGATMRRALEAVTCRPESVVLLGITPDAPDSDYGWILPRAGADVWPEPIVTFLEKPPREIASGLMARGGLWNSFVVVADGQTLIRLYQRRLPGLVEGLDAAWRSASRRRLAAFYEALSPADFSRDLLQGSESDLRVLATPACGWSDLGTPERVASCIEQLAHGGLEPPAARPEAAPPVVLSRACRIGQLVEA
jgi:mannose-1-phosphate guanylyltransferase